MERRIFGITGWKNSGKTTLTERLVAEFHRRGVRLATVKHAHHEFDVDHEGTDSWRHRKAGASEVAIVSSRRVAIMRELEADAEPSLAEVIARLAPCDLVLVEGYKQEPHPKIEVRRLTARETRPLAGSVPNVLAIAADHPVVGGHLPAFSLDDVAAIADFIAAATDLT